MLNNLKIGVKLVGMQATMLILLIAVGVTGIYGMGQIAAGLHTVYEDRTVCLVQLSHILDAIHRMRANILRMAATPAGGSEAAVQRGLEKIAEADQEHDKEWRDYTSSYFTPEEKLLADTLAGKHAGYLKKRAASLDLVKAGVRGERLDAAVVEAGAAFDETRDALKKLVTLQERVALEEYTKATKLFETLRSGDMVLMAAALVMAGLLSLLAFRSIAARVTGMTAAMHRLAGGDTTAEVPSVGHGDEIGAMADAVQVFKDNALAMERMRADQERQ
ncbi:MAG: MCP four helix bundle domain-containing protein, partial [Rhodospirillaceae bacterium]